MSQLFLSEMAACMPMFYVALLCHNWNARLQKFTIMVKKGLSTSNGNGINTATNTYKDPWMQKQQENYFTNFENDLCMVTMPPPPWFAFFVLGGLFPTPGINAERDNSPPRAPDRPRKTCFWGTSFWKENWFLHNSKTKCIQSFYKCVLELI